MKPFNTTNMTYALLLATNFTDSSAQILQQNIFHYTYYVPDPVGSNLLSLQTNYPPVFGVIQAAVGASVYYSGV